MPVRFANFLHPAESTTSNASTWSYVWLSDVPHPGAPPPCTSFSPSTWHLSVELSLLRRNSFISAPCTRTAQYLVASASQAISSKFLRSPSAITCSCWHIQTSMAYVVVALYPGQQVRDTFTFPRKSCFIYISTASFGVAFWLLAREAPHLLGISPCYQRH